MALEFLSCVQTALLSDSYDHFFLKAKEVIFWSVCTFNCKKVFAHRPANRIWKIFRFKVLPYLLKDEDARKPSSQAGPLVDMNVSPLNSLMYDQINFRVLLTFNNKIPAQSADNKLGGRLLSDPDMQSNFCHIATVICSSSPPLFFMWLPKSGNHMTCRNQGSFSKLERRPWERGCYRIAGKCVSFSPCVQY